jgi:serine protease Do
MQSVEYRFTPEPATQKNWRLHSFPEPSACRKCLTNRIFFETTDGYFYKLKYEPSITAKVGLNMRQRNKFGKASPAPWLGGTAIGVALASAFWIGHEWHPGTTTTPTQTTTSTSSFVSKTPAGVMGLAENTIADIASKVSDSVVNIDTRRSITLASASGFDPMQSFLFGPGMGFEIPQQQQRPRIFEQKGTGSGVIFRSDGYILTNNHVAGNADVIEVTLNDKRKYRAKVVGKDRFTDLALLKIDGVNNLPAANFGESKALRPGDWAIAIGSPLGFDHTVTLGIISALGRLLPAGQNETSSLGNVQLIQTDAAINPGNSGGPLLNIHGDVIGITTAIRGDAQNIGFAIPVDVAKDVAQQLLDKGSIARAYIGIYMQDLNDGIARSLHVSPNTKGVLVARAAEGSPAEKAGLSQGDVIVKVDGQTVTNSKEVQAIVRKHKPGDNVEFLLSRGNELVAATIKIGDYPQKDEG